MTGPAASEPPALPRGERWRVTTAVLVLVLFPLLIPDHLRLGPRWLMTAVGVVFLGVIVVAVYRSTPSRAATRVRRLTLTLTGLLIAASGWMTVLLIRDLITGGPVSNSASTLLATGAVIWLNNALLFGLLYWEIDGGGLIRRAAGAEDDPDFAFPQQLSPGIARPGWQPSIVDYLYVGLTNGTAFSPTDAMPLTAKAKLIMGVQALSSLVILGLVVARAVNIFT